ncbi:MAG: LacI family transcriptional regulator [Anaerolineaceae bacterium]|nr:LacI family transcriptional regulator [Anaerolineaceae bacterium]
MVTLKDVAKLAGVSYQTVSKVLHGTISVSSATEERIYQAISNLDYRPNRAAQNLKTAKSKAIGYSWTPSKAGEYNPILESFLQGMMNMASSSSYDLLCFPGNQNNSVTNNRYRELFYSRRVDGFILSNVETNDSRIGFLKKMNIPFAAFGWSKEDVDYPAVDIDGYEGMQRVVDHLCQTGCHRIALLAWQGNSRVGNERVRGFLSAYQEKYPCSSEPIICYGQGTVASGYMLAKQVLKDDSIDAIAALNDLMAIGVFQAIKETGKTVGADIAVTGYDNFPMTEHLAPSLTTVDQPAKEAGKSVVELLIDSLEGQGGIHKPTSYLLQPDLLIRESTQR